MKMQRNVENTRVNGKCKPAKRFPRMFRFRLMFKLIHTNGVMTIANTRTSKFYFPRKRAN